MKKLIILSVLFVSGCASLTPKQKEGIMVGASILAIGFVVSNDKGGNSCAVNCVDSIDLKYPLPPR